MPETTMPKQPQVEYLTPPEGIFATYANNVAFGASQFDVRLAFGEILDVTPEKMRVLTRAQIIMSWLQAKALAAFLHAHVEAFEKANGPLVLPNLPTTPVPMANPFEVKPK